MKNTIISKITGGLWACLCRLVRCEAAEVAEWQWIRLVRDGKTIAVEPYDPEVESLYEGKELKLFGKLYRVERLYREEGLEYRDNLWTAKISLKSNNE